MIDAQKMFMECLQVANVGGFFTLTYFSNKYCKIKTHTFKKWWEISSYGDDTIVLLNRHTKKEHMLFTSHILGLDVGLSDYDFSGKIRSWLLQLNDPCEKLSFYDRKIPLGHLTCENFTKVTGSDIEVIFDNAIMKIPLEMVNRVRYDADYTISGEYFYE